MEKSISVDTLDIIGNNEVRCKISCSRELRKYFLDSFYAKYDRDIQNVDRSILQIPAISNIITVAWATGADVYVKELDKTYLESLEKVKKVMKGMYPELPFSSNIYVDKVVSNSISGQNQGAMCLFSGGIDSITSYIRHKNERPNLVTVWGAEIRLNEEKEWNKAKKEVLRFADKEQVKVNFIKSNLGSFINTKLLTLEYGRYLPSPVWWASVQHGLGLTGLCAPLTVAANIKTVYIAASYTQDFEHPWGSHPSIDNNISWANIKVVHDGYDLSRQEKIRYIANNYIRTTGRYPLLRVCNKKITNQFNCSRCEKCYRTITGLVLEGIDPNKCGFNVDNETFKCIRYNLSNNKIQFGKDEVFMWKDIQRYIPDTIDHNLYDSVEFFRWFKDFNILANNKLLYSVYFNLPKSMQSILSHARILQAIALIRRKFIR